MTARRQSARQPQQRFLAAAKIRLTIDMCDGNWGNDTAIVTGIRDTRDMGPRPIVVALERASKDYITEGVAVPALREVSLEVERGEFVALVGRSGCGKSTLLNLAGAMDVPTTGRVVLEGIDTATAGDAGLTRLRREHVGFIFQSFQLLPVLSVVENVELPLLLAGRPGARERALEQLRWLEIEAFASRMPYQLSGGQMQRVAIARALVHAPALLLADEPTGNLDSATSDLILTLLRRISTETNTAILMATHSTEAAAMADAVVHLRDGAVQEIRQATARQI
jgi:putative ABC transport system ATP-binding protein